MDQASHLFYKTRVRQELRAKNHFDKVVHIHKQSRMVENMSPSSESRYAQTIVSRAQATETNNEILRMRNFSNQMTVTNANKGGRPMFFLATSNGTSLSDPNTIRD